MVRQRHAMPAPSWQRQPFAMRFFLLANLIWLLLFSWHAQGQEPSTGKRVKRGLMVTEPIGPGAPAETPPPGPQATPPAPTAPLLPPLPETPPQESLSSSERVFIRAILVAGNTLLPEEEITGLTAGYSGREVTLEELFELRNRLTLLYLNRGYVTSGAVLPEQEIHDGVLRYQMIEGRLTQVRVSGNQYLTPEFISSRLAGPAEAALQMGELEERFQLLRQHEMVESVQAELRPGAAPGEAVLDVQVEEATPLELRFGYNNQSSPNLGDRRTDLGFTVWSLLRHGDRIDLDYSRASGLSDYRLAFAIPLNARDTTLSLMTSRTTSAVVVPPFDQLDIRSRARTWSATLRHPLRRNTREELALALGLERRSSRTTLLGQPFAFSPGSPDGHTVVTVANLDLERIQRDQKQVLALISTLSKGLDVGDATRNQNAPDGNFLAWKGQLQWIRRLPWQESRLLVRGAARFTNHPMLATEKFALGGMNTVRGYRENRITRDQAVVASAELQLPTRARIPLPRLSPGEEDGRVWAALFADYGAGWDKGVQVNTPRDISSMGVGLVWQINDRSSATFYLADRLRRVPTEDRHAQDRGIHFRLQLTYPF